MDYNFRYNTNPYKERTTHIPYTHYESERLSKNKILFLFNSIVKKFDLFDKSLDLLDMDINNGQYDFPDRYKELKSILTDTDEKALRDFNAIFKPIVGGAGYFEDGTIADASSISDKSIDLSMSLVEDYLLSSGSNDRYISDTIYNPNGEVYPYSLNIVDTTVPADIFYELKTISEGLTVVIVYSPFLDYLKFEEGNDKVINKKMINLTKKLLINQLQFSPYNELYKSGLLPLFSFYLKSL